MIEWLDDWEICECHRMEMVAQMQGIALGNDGTRVEFLDDGKFGTIVAGVVYACVSGPNAVDDTMAFGPYAVIEIAVKPDGAEDESEYVIIATFVDTSDLSAISNHFDDDDGDDNGNPEGGHYVH